MRRKNFCFHKKMILFFPCSAKTWSQHNIKQKQNMWLSRIQHIHVHKNLVLTSGNYFTNHKLIILRTICCLVHKKYCQQDNLTYSLWLERIFELSVVRAIFSRSALRAASFRFFSWSKLASAKACFAASTAILQPAIIVCGWSFCSISFSASRSNSAAEIYNKLINPGTYVLQISIVYKVPCVKSARLPMAIANFICQKWPEGRPKLRRIW